jgi:hypothetical protein
VLSSSESGFRRASSRCLVRRGFYPWRRLIVPHFEHASRHLDFVSGTPSSHKGGSRASSPDPRHRNSRRHPLSLEPSPSRGTSIRIRTGKRRSASAIMNAELGAIDVFRFCSSRGLARHSQEVHMVGVPTSLCSPSCAAIRRYRCIVANLPLPQRGRSRGLLIGSFADMPEMANERAD